MPSTSLRRTSSLRAASTTAASPAATTPSRSRKRPARSTTARATGRLRSGAPASAPPPSTATATVRRQRRRAAAGGASAATTTTRPGRDANTDGASAWMPISSVRAARKASVGSGNDVMVVRARSMAEGGGGPPLPRRPKRRTRRCRGGGVGGQTPTQRRRGGWRRRPPRARMPWMHSYRGEGVGRRRAGWKDTATGWRAREGDTDKELPVQPLPVVGSEEAPPGVRFQVDATGTGR
ncbi:hypothetical protein BU14_1139s0001 [Porphyra umbilicalis]|uniref:Uncharacterized protein n=1 Tax=Porphyra umbilicalis TaxID=2786 RepID=A0A1X6NMK3_PORUM|nr:hypothetical protein BU14_1139s0001 [Porphyra umbilicalis]|eukprot:OSX69802.1 hypothetical protein BU14_1139s0001 [Porphyra umbilicalis]